MKKVLLAMSGGVDSSVSAILLKKMGYEVIGVTMKLVDKTDEIESARNVCRDLGIEHYTLNLVDEFKKCVVNNFFESYQAGETPNPCIVCNKNIKFGRLYEFAKEKSCDYFSTGHYAITEYDENLKQHVIKKSKAKYKDQTYVLYGINKEIIEKLIFPLGEFENKDQIRSIAQEHGLNVANKKDSQDICFIPNNDYSAYIKETYNYIAKKGNIVDLKGNILGVHNGLINYTIGQRKGIGLTSENPLYVISIQKDKNELVVGSEEELYSKELIASNLNFLIHVNEGIELSAKIRYSTKEAEAKILFIDESNIKVIFNEPQRAITPGQSIVFYKGDILAGGGIIKSKEKLL